MKWVCGTSGSGFSVWNNNYVATDIVNNPPYTVTYHIHQDINGNFYSGSGSDGSIVKPYKFSSDLTLDTDWPSYSVWETAGNHTIYSVRPTNDGQYVYVVSTTGITAASRNVIKLTADTGSLVWTKTAPGSDARDIGVLANGNVIVPFGQIVGLIGRPQIWDADDGSVVLTYLSQIPGGSYYRIIVAEELDMWFTCGVANTGVTGYGIVQGWSTIEDSGWDFDPWAGTQSCLGIAYANGYLYCVTPRVIYNGDYVTIFKLNATDGSVVSTATSPTAFQDIAINNDGSIVTIHLAGTSHRWHVYDHNLNELATYNATGTEGQTWRLEQVPDPIQYGGYHGLASDGYWEEIEIGYNHLEGETVSILADGVVYPDQVVTNGDIDDTAFADATEVHVGLAYESKLKPMKPVSQPDMMSAVVTCKQMGISVHNTDDIKYGVHDDDMKAINFDDVQWKNKCEIDGLFTGTVCVSVPDGFSVNLPLQITTDASLPCTVRAMIPKVD